MTRKAVTLKYWSLYLKLFTFYVDTSRWIACSPKNGNDLKIEISLKFPSVVI